MFIELNAALTVAKHLRDVQARLKDTEFATLLADLQMALADVKVRCALAEEDTRQVQAKCRELEEKLSVRGKMSFKAPVWYMEGDPTPLCPVCWERNGKPIHLQGPCHSDGDVSYFCQACEKTVYTHTAERQPHVDDPGWLPGGRDAGY